MDARTDGGLPSADPNEIYYVGVIDMLVPYSTRKKLEVRTSLITTSCLIETDEWWVGLQAQTRGRLVNARHGADALSVTDPKTYANRLLDFVAGKTSSDGSVGRGSRGYRPR